MKHVHVHVYQLVGASSIYIPGGPCIRENLFCRAASIASSCFSFNFLLSPFHNVKQLGLVLSIFKYFAAVINKSRLDNYIRSQYINYHYVFDEYIFCQVRHLLQVSTTLHQYPFFEVDKKGD